MHSSHAERLSPAPGAAVPAPAIGTVDGRPDVARKTDEPSRRRHLVTLAFSTLVVATLAWGWSIRGEHYLTAEEGLGYALGIAGGSFMLALLLYPLRKNVRFMRGWGELRHWFRLHMFLGILGPVAILFHAGFGLGSINSNVALWSMLIVAASGVIGRFIYTRIHHGLYGRRASLEDLRQRLQIDKGRLGGRFRLAVPTRQRLLAFEHRARAPRGPFGGMAALFTVPLDALITRIAVARRLRTEMGALAKLRGWDREIRDAITREARTESARYIRAVVKEAQFTRYERLFSIWHTVHIPLFVMLIVSGIVHVVAVHMY